MLTWREREIADMVARGLSNREVAVQLCISERTVADRVERICGKLGISSRDEILARLRQQPRRAGEGQLAEAVGELE